MTSLRSSAIPIEVPGGLLSVRRSVQAGGELEDEGDIADRQVSDPVEIHEKRSILIVFSFILPSVATTSSKLTHSRKISQRS